MALKDLFRGGGKGRPRSASRGESYSTSDLIALGRLDEARQRLEAKVKSQPRQHHSRLQLADLLMKQGRGAEAIDAYLQVADGYAADGFFDKAHALLAKLGRLLPDEDRIRAKMKRLEVAQELERKRGIVVKAVADEGKVTLSSFTLQSLWPKIAKCSLIEALDDDQLSRFFTQVTIEKVHENQWLVEAGADRHELFVIIQGEIAAQIRLATGKRTDIRTFGPGDIIGDDALLKRRSWPAGYLARKRTSMFRLDRDGLERLLLGETDPRGLLDALRAQGHDAQVSKILKQLSRAE